MLHVFAGRQSTTSLVLGAYRVAHAEMHQLSFNSMPGAAHASCGSITPYLARSQLKCQQKQRDKAAWSLELPHSRGHILPDYCGQHGHFMTFNPAQPMNQKGLRLCLASSTGLNISISHSNSLNLVCCGVILCAACGGHAALGKSPWVTQVTGHDAPKLPAQYLRHEDAQGWNAGRPFAVRNKDQRNCVGIPGKA
eukprot:scaffold309024_cov22-Tisochrysis_lutea.AAC.1